MEIHLIYQVQFPLEVSISLLRNNYHSRIKTTTDSIHIPYDFFTNIQLHGQSRNCIIFSRYVLSVSFFLFGKNIVIKRMTGSELLLFDELMFRPILHFRYIFVQVDFEVNLIEFFLFLFRIGFSEEI